MAWRRCRCNNSVAAIVETCWDDLDGQSTCGQRHSAPAIDWSRVGLHRILDVGRRLGRVAGGRIGQQGIECVGLIRPTQFFTDAAIA